MNRFIDSLSTYKGLEAGARGGSDRLSTYKALEAGARGGSDRLSTYKGLDAGARGGSDSLSTYKGLEAGARGGSDRLSTYKGLEAGARGGSDRLCIVIHISTCKSSESHFRHDSSWMQQANVLRLTSLCALCCQHIIIMSQWYLCTFYINKCLCKLYFKIMSK